MADTLRRALAVISWSALWISLGGDPERIVMPPDNWVMPVQPSEAVAQVREMIAKTDDLFSGFGNGQG